MCIYIYIYDYIYIYIYIYVQEPGLCRGLALGAPPYELAGLFGMLDRWGLVRWHAIPAAAAFVRQHVGGLSVPIAVF